MEKYIVLLQNYATEFGIKIIAALAVFLIGKWVAKKLKKAAEKIMTKGNVDITLIKFASNLTYTVLLIVVILAALGQLGVQTTSFLAILGAAGLAVGLALQGSLSNFASGVLIIFFRPFKVGDFVELAGKTGTVSQIQIFTTELKTPDNKVIIIPNSQITSSVITNFSAEDTRRVDLKFGIGYGDDLLKAKKILNDLVNSDSRILKEPAPFVAVSELADSSVNFVVRVWVNAPDYWAVFFDMNEKVKLTFDKEGISIPFPQRDVHLYNHNS